MLTRIFKTHKKLCIWVIAAIAAALVALYLYVALLPGIWHQDTFLYQESDGSFSGKNVYSEYKMNIAQTSSGADVFFSVNDTVREYSIAADENARTVEIFEDGASVFRGSALVNGDSVMLLDEEDKLADFNVQAHTSGEIFTVPDESEQFPSYTSLYTRAICGKVDRRGNLVMALFAVLLAALLVIDIRYPDFFFLLKYGLHVDGGEPSAFYRAGQKVGRIICLMAVIGFIVASFVVH